ncbi:RH39 [Symbiodinium pilosum]|uniref:RH39 protein n=1 Tax=Symbiodinium pilosum TaxID=2952 RepID=A0A812XJ25_SYMPI|nr:RH39 [Symbiodinium pilosum]
MEEVDEWKRRPMEATILQQGIEMERQFGRPYFDEKRGIGKVCDWLPHRGFGYLLCGSPPEKLIFRADDVPADYLDAHGGQVPMEADVEFAIAGTFRGRKRAKDLVFPTSGSFAELGLKPEVIEGAANSLGLDPRENPEAPALLNPAPVQQEAIPYILNGDNIVIAAETGSGKSLAYMLPMVQIVRGMAQARNMDYGLAYRAGCPLALAICPTRELAIQAYKTLKLISHHARCRVRLVHGGSMTWRTQRQEISQVVDILVCTPDRLLKFYNSKDIRLEEVAYIAIDEADFLLTQGFDDLYKILDLVDEDSRHKRQMRYSLITASITKPLWRIFQEDRRFRTLRILESNSLHRPQANCSHTMVLTKGRCKVRMLVQLVQRDLGEESLRRGLTPRQTLVFCNTLSSCKSVGFQLKEKYSHVQEKIGILHKEMQTAERKEVLRKFVDGEYHVVVSTDLAQRGLDLPNCEHVINFDFPLNSIDYLHRAGRTARYGEPGKVTSLVKKGDKYLAKAIERCVQLGKPINELSSDKRDYLRGGALGELMERHPRAAKYLSREERGLPARKPYAGGLR